MTPATSRSIARDVLVRVEDGAYSNLVLPAMLRRSTLSLRDRAFTTNLVYGTLRRRRRLDALIDEYGRRKIDDLDPPVRAVLRLATAQLLDGVPAHAAVSASVDTAPPRSRGYVNAVLRAMTAAGPPWPEPAAEAVALSYPDWVVARLYDDLGAVDGRAALVAQNEPGAVTLRPNPRRSEADALVRELEAAGLTVERGALLPDALVVRGSGDPATLSAVADGRATPQDQASQAVVAVLGPDPGDRVLEVAAAPGGKATACAERVGDTGLVVAADIDPGRLRLVVDAQRRLGLDHLHAVVADGRQLPVRAGTFDRVLVDAPCSGLGVLRRRAEARWRVEEASIPGLADLQVALVLAAAAAVRAGGVLIYSVCTMTTAETVRVAERVREALGPDFEPLPAPGAPWRPAADGALLLPQDARTDGMFLLALRRGR
jgi:16S rRNA (cytosine967-C5)-methyltransferase